jgi:hypothetical protein
MKSAKFTLLPLTLFLVLAITTACKRALPPPPPANYAHLCRLTEALPGNYVIALLEEATPNLTNRQQVFAVLYARVYADALDSLALQPVGELKRKLDTLRRGTSHHPYSREMLVEALKRKGVKVD